MDDQTAIRPNSGPWLVTARQAAKILHPDLKAADVLPLVDLGAVAAFELGDRLWISLASLHRYINEEQP